MGRPVMTPKVDNITGAALIIDHAEHDVHDGNSFTIHHEGVGGGAGEETAISFETPVTANGLIHLIVNASANDESVFEIREGPTIVLAQGVEVAPLKRFRDHTNESIMRGSNVAGTVNRITTYNVAEAAAGDLAIGTGTILHHETLAVGGVGPFGAAGNAASRGQREFILAAEEDYVIILTQSGAGAATHEISMSWSEEEGGDFAN